MRITDAVSPSIARARRVLFQPFDIGKWLAFGFVFFLASLIDPIAGWNGRLDLPSFDRHTTTGPLPDISDIPPDLAQHGATIVTVAAIALVIGTAAGIVIAWIGARGLMMAYRSVSMGYVGIGESWRETARPANALFRLQLLVLAIASVLGLPVAALAVMQVIGLYQSGERDAAVMIRSLVPYFFVLGILGVAIGMVGFVIRQFIAPFLLFFPGTVRQAWSRFFDVFKSNPGGVIAFFFARVLLAGLIGILSSIVATCTCCIGGLPVLQQTVLAPALLFDRAFTLQVLASIGPEYAQMAPELPPPNLWRR